MILTPPLSRPPCPLASRRTRPLATVSDALSARTQRNPDRSSARLARALATDQPTPACPALTRAEISEQSEASQQKGFMIQSPSPPSRPREGASLLPRSSTVVLLALDLAVRALLVRGG